MKRGDWCARWGSRSTKNTYRRIGVERGDGFRRMWIGQDIHTQRAEQRAAEDPHYRAEVHVVHRDDGAGWNVTVTGRIDGLSVDNEAKRGHDRRGEVDPLRPRARGALRGPRSCNGISTSCCSTRYFCHRSPTSRVRVRAAARAHRPRHRRDEDRSTRSSIAEGCDDPVDTLDPLIDELESAEALREAKKRVRRDARVPVRARCARTRTRSSNAVAHAIREREALLVSAPTGIGKTIAALYPAVRESLRAGKKLFFLTSKTMQQDAAVNALGCSTTARSACCASAPNRRCARTPR